MSCVILYLHPPRGTVKIPSRLLSESAEPLPLAGYDIFLTTSHRKSLRDCIVLNRFAVYIS